MALIGLYEAGIVTSFVTGLPPHALLATGGSTMRAPDAPLKLGNLRDPQVLLAAFGFLLITVLQHRRVRGAILLGMATTGGLGMALGFGTLPKHVTAMPFTGDYTLALAFQLDIPGVLKLSFLPVLLTLFLMGFLDTLGTLVAVGAAGDLLDEKGNPRWRSRCWWTRCPACSAAWSAPPRPARTSSRPRESAKARAPASPQ